MHSGFDGDLKLSNEVTGESIVTSGIILWSHGGRSIIFYHEDLEEVNKILRPSSTMSVEHFFAAPGGETFNIERVHHWAWRSMHTYFFVDPLEYSAQSCDEAASDFNGRSCKGSFLGNELFSLKLTLLFANPFQPCLGFNIRLALKSLGNLL